MNKACVVGYGMVGKATSSLFGIESHLDIDESRSNLTTDDAAKFKFIFICLPTPVKDGEYDTKPILDTIKNIEFFKTEPIYIIRSTVDPGFANKVKNILGINRIVSNPEFLSEKTWENDIKFPPFVVLGGDPDITEKVRALYMARIKSCPILMTDNTTAEMAKLALNGFFTVKVAYANEIFDLCQETGANYEKVKEVLERHPYGYKNHATIFHQGGRGAGGKCLPKDMEALSNISNSAFLSWANINNQELLKRYPKHDQSV